MMSGGISCTVCICFVLWGGESVLPSTACSVVFSVAGRLFMVFLLLNVFLHNLHPGKRMGRGSNLLPRGGAEI